MRGHWAVLLVFAIILANVVVAVPVLGRSEKKSLSSMTQLRAPVDDKPIRDLSSLYNAADVNGAETGSDSEQEERAFISVLPKIPNLAKKTSRMFALRQKVWAWSGKHPKDAFCKALQLGETGLKLDDNPKLLQWLRYTDKYRGKNRKREFSDMDTYMLLREATPDVTTKGGAHSRELNLSCELGSTCEEARVKPLK
jgi:hypothetical protein